MQKNPIRKDVRVARFQVPFRCAVIACVALVACGVRAGTADQELPPWTDEELELSAFSSPGRLGRHESHGQRKSFRVG